MMHDRETGGGTSPHDIAVVARPVLLVEDSPTAAAFIEAALRATRLCNPVVVVSTLAAAAAAVEGGLRPALLLLDYELPDGSGADLLRSHGERLASTPVIILSANEGAREIDEAHRLGVIAYLVKPVAYDAVEDVIRRLSLPWYLGRLDEEPS
jgi:response regulator of citrate/malate metabolism